MASDVSTPTDLAKIWSTVSVWPPDRRRELAVKLLYSLERENGPMPIAERLDELRALNDGWFDGKGLAPSHKGLDWLASAFDQQFANDLPRPFLYPTAEGAIQAEWTLGDHDVSVEINLANHHAEWQCVHLQMDEQEDRDLNFNDANEWKWIVERIRSLQGDGK